MDVIITGYSKNCEFCGIDTFLFDLDGTLINTLDLHIEAFQWILKKLGKNVSKAELSLLMGMTPHDIISRFFKDIDPEEVWQAAKEKEDYLETLIKHVNPFEGVVDLLRQIKYNNGRVVVISSTYKELVIILLKNSGLYGYIDIIISGEDITKGKPDPEPFLKGLHASGSTKTHALGFGDSIYDAQSCTSAGIPFVGVLTGKTRAEKFMAGSFECLVQTVRDIRIK